MLIDNVKQRFEGVEQPLAVEARGQIGSGKLVKNFTWVTSSANASLVPAINKRSLAQRINDMKSQTISAVILALLVSAPLVADDHSSVEQEHRLREVEVSLWELVAAAMFHAAEPELSVDGVSAKQEWTKQLGDVDEHWTAWRKIADADQYSDVADQFEAEYKTFVELGTVVIDADEPTAEQVIEMYRQAHKTDDVIDEYLKVKS